jgi:hypothetical protein
MVSNSAKGRAGGIALGGSVVNGKRNLAEAAEAIDALSPDQRIRVTPLIGLPSFPNLGVQH